MYSLICVLGVPFAIIMLWALWEIVLVPLYEALQPPPKPRRNYPKAECPRCNRNYEYDEKDQLKPGKLCPECWTKFQAGGQQETSRCESCRRYYTVAPPYFRWYVCQPCQGYDEIFRRGPEQHEEVKEAQAGMAQAVHSQEVLGEVFNMVRAMETLGGPGSADVAMDLMRQSAVDKLTLSEGMLRFHEITTGYQPSTGIVQPRTGGKLYGFAWIGTGPDDWGNIAMQQALSSLLLAPEMKGMEAKIVALITSDPAQQKLILTSLATAQRTGDASHLGFGLAEATRGKLFSRTENFGVLPQTLKAQWAARWNEEKLPLPEKYKLWKQLDEALRGETGLVGRENYGLRDGHPEAFSLHRATSQEGNMQFRCPRCDRQYEHRDGTPIRPGHLCPLCWTAFQAHGQRETSQCKACLDYYVVALPHLRWDCCKSCWDDFEEMEREQARDAGATYEELREAQPSDFD